MTGKFALDTISCSCTIDCAKHPLQPFCRRRPRALCHRQIMKFGLPRDPQLSFLLLVNLLVIAGATVWSGGQFASADNLQSMASQLPEIGLLAIGVMLTMISGNGGIDLSGAAMANLAGVVGALVAPQFVSPDDAPVLFTVLFAAVALVSLTRWFKDELARDLEEPGGYATLFEGAARVAPGAGGLLVLPYFSGERTPINDTRASGVIAGLSLSHSREQLFRAVLEGVGFGVRHNLEAFADIGAKVNRVVAVGGGAQGNTWLQIVSDITQVEQEAPAVTVGASFGDAFLAGCAAGLIRRSDIAQWVRPGRRIVPDPSRRAVYDRMYAQYRKLYDGTRDVMHALKAMASDEAGSGPA